MRRRGGRRAAALALVGRSVAATGLVSALLGFWSLLGATAGVPDPVAAPFARSLVFLFAGVSLFAAKRGRRPATRALGLAAAGAVLAIGLAASGLALAGLVMTPSGVQPLDVRGNVTILLVSRGVLVCPPLGAALLLLHLRRGGRAALVLAGIASWLAAVELLGTLYARPGGAWVAHALSVPTATVHLLLALGATLAASDGGVARVLLSRRPGGRVARRLLPAVLFSAVALGGLVLWGLRAHAFGDELGVALLATTAAFLGAAIIISRGAQLDREEAARRRAEDSLRASEERFKALVENGMDAILLFAADGTTLYHSPSAARILGVPPGSRVGRSGFELIHPEDLARVSAAWAECLAEPGRTVNAMMRLRRGDGSYAEIEAVAANRLADRAVRAVVINYRDVSERHRLEEELRQSQKMQAIGQLAGGVAHDFNNLLGVMLGHADLLRRKLGTERAPALRHVEAIRTAAERAAGLTRQLLAFSRKQVLHPRVLDLNDVVRGVAPLLRRLIGEHVELSTALATDLPRVTADAGQLEQVLLNLAVNARDAMPGGGQLRVATELAQLDAAAAGREPGARPGPYARLSVSDTGCGMDAATRARVFEPFFTTKEVGKGTGLGLATVYGIVRQSGGFVSVESEPGRGARFDVFLPATGEAAAEADEPRAAPAPPASGGETVLVVEDEPSLRSLIGEALTGAGYRALVGGSPAAALALSRAHDGPIDLLLTDVVMPGMSGREVARRLAAERALLRVLYISGYAPEGQGPDPAGQATDALLAKPFTVEALLRRVRDALDAPPAG